MRVLIIDDEAGILSTLSRHLALQEIECVTCSSALDAIDKHDKELFPVIVSDIRMPEMTGIDVIKKVKAIHPSCIVFVMTGYSSMPYLLECLELGAADYFTKPFKDIDFIIKQISEGLHRYERWMKDLVATKRQKKVS